MTYQIATRPMPGYLHVTVTGENTVQNVTGYISRVGQMCDEQKFSTVLIEENLQGPGLNMFDIFKVIKGLQQTPKVLRWIVYVDTNPAHDPDRMEFARELAIRRGLRVHICRSVREAQDWIEVWVK